MDIREELTSTLIKMRCLAETYNTDADIGFRRGWERTTGSLIHGLADEIEAALSMYAEVGDQGGRSNRALKTA
jgi:hypothetical protein